MKGFDARPCQLDSVDHGRVELGIGGGDLLLAHLQLAQFDAVDALCPVDERSIAAFARTSERIRRTASSGVNRSPKSDSSRSRIGSGISSSSQAGRRRMVDWAVGRECESCVSAN